MLDLNHDSLTRVGMSPGPMLNDAQPDRQLDDKVRLLENMRSVIRLEADALVALSMNLDDSFCDAVELLYGLRGKVILTGVGKSGLIARKIAATMNSTGTIATFLHPSDAMHGDLGVLSKDDAVLAIGKSGESDELLQMLPAIKRLGAKIIAVTASPKSTLAQHADIVLYTPVNKEACPLDLAPTVSTTVALAVGDALAMTLMKMKNFQSEDFAKYHPGGRLGKRLLLRVNDLMIERDRCPIVDPRITTIDDVIAALGDYGLGIVLFSQDGQALYGLITDGDIRRMLRRHKGDIFRLPLADFINRNPVTTHSQVKAVEALQIMEDRTSPLNVLPIVDQGKIVGILRLHELVSIS